MEEASQAKNLSCCPKLWQRIMLRLLGSWEVTAGLLVIAFNLLAVYMIPYTDFAVIHAAVFFVALMYLISGLSVILATRLGARPNEAAVGLALHSVFSALGVLEMIFLVGILMVHHRTFSFAEYMIALIKREYAPTDSQEYTLWSFYTVMTFLCLFTALTLSGSALLAFQVLQTYSKFFNRSAKAARQREADQAIAESNTPATAQLLSPATEN